MYLSWSRVLQFGIEILKKMSYFLQKYTFLAQFLWLLMSSAMPPKYAITQHIANNYGYGRIP